MSAQEMARRMAEKIAGELPQEPCLETRMALPFATALVQSREALARCQPIAADRAAGVRMATPREDAGEASRLARAALAAIAKLEEE